jgi:tetratricopeptide (TPR) repeat protein
MITEEDLAKLDEITFVLEGRDKPTLLCLSVGSYKKAEELSRAVEERLPAYRFQTLNLRGQQVGSLFQAIREQVPARVLESKPVEYLLHVYGLEDSLFISRGENPTLSTLIQELNFERENLFRIFPFCILLWTTPYFVDNLKKHAPDLWDWITYSYSFDDTESSDTEQFDAENWQNLPVGRLKEREQRIKELEQRFSSLALSQASTERVLREKITVQKLLGRECAAAFRFPEAVRAYQSVLALLRQLPKKTVDEEAELHYLLGETQLEMHDFSQAHEHFRKSLLLQQQTRDPRNFGATYHQIGMVYHAQRRWDDALYNYKKALNCKKKVGLFHELGSCYHQIGRVYQEQRHYSEALDNYEQALAWKIKTGQQHLLGITYHQIGRLFELQRSWKDALDNYKKALKFYEKTDQHYLGGTYQQIGTVYMEQELWGEALDNYEKALRWQEKTGQHHQIGGTYHQIGRVYHEQQRWSEALESYESALKWEEDSNQHHQIGGTYHQIGNIYIEQRCWREALESLRKALVWEEKTGQLYLKGRTLHQIGRVYEEQRRWSEALRFYIDSFIWIVRYDKENAQVVEAAIARIRAKIHRHRRERLFQKVTGQLPDELKGKISHLLLGKEEAVA